MKMLKVIYEIYKKKQGYKKERVAVVSSATKAVKYIREHLPSDNTTAAMTRDVFSHCICSPYLDDVLNTKDITKYSFCGSCHGGYFTYAYEVDRVNVE